jgi:hypothetical protein
MHRGGNGLTRRAQNTRINTELLGRREFRPRDNAGCFLVFPWRSVPSV